ncbi:hypothetical protein LCGC14_2005410 [marine sediment metagenome]|uniref:Uncharacterized protein n=1 Tax=marine sediment metagenome TaxID=412755 RepID=A0A0F9F208_9ZZZZ
MSHFYGTVTGSAVTAATRRGTKDSCLVTEAASYQGCVQVFLYEKNGRDYAEVSLKPWQGCGSNRLLWEGPIDGKRRPNKK